MHADLTEGQAKVLDFIKGYMTRHGYPPSQIEIAAAFRMSRTTATYYCKQLRLKHKVRKKRNLFIPVQNGELE